MALALDSYPPGEKDPHEAVKFFPDTIIRKDVLDELQPAGQDKVLPKAPPVPPCMRCAAQGVSIRCKNSIIVRSLQVIVSDFCVDSCRSLSI